MQDEQTIQELLAQLQEDPEDWALRARICDAMLLDGRVGEASSLIDTAPTPPEEESHVLKAAEVFSQSQPQKAVPLLYRHLQATPLSALAHLAMAETAVRLGQLSSAQSYYERAVALNPGYSDPEFEKRHSLHLPPSDSGQPSPASPFPFDLPSVGTFGPAPTRKVQARRSRTEPGRISSWLLTAMVALVTFLLCWILLGLGLREGLLQTFPEH